MKTRLKQRVTELEDDLKKSKEELEKAKQSGTNQGEEGDVRFFFFCALFYIYELRPLTLRSQVVVKKSFPEINHMVSINRTPELATSLVKQMYVSR